jgi:hypothetical protein
MIVKQAYHQRDEEHKTATLQGANWGKKLSFSGEACKNDI